MSMNSKRKANIQLNSYEYGPIHHLLWRTPTAVQPFSTSTWRTHSSPVERDESLSCYHARCLGTNSNGGVSGEMLTAVSYRSTAVAPVACAYTVSVGVAFPSRVAVSLVIASLFKLWISAEGETESNRKGRCRNVLETLRTVIPEPSQPVEICGNEHIDKIPTASAVRP